MENFISFWNGDQMEQLMEVNVPYIYVIANNVKWQIISINREVGRYEFSACYQTAADCPNRVVNQGSLSRSYCGGP